MRRFSNLWTLDRKFPWSSLSFALGLLFGLFGIYTTFFYERKPRIVYEIVSESPVYDIREDVPKLDILFQGESIRQKHETLTVIVLKIANAGNADIGMSAYDPSNLPGVTITTGTLIKLETLGASSDYLMSNRVQQKTEQSLDILPGLLDKQAFFILKMLVLHPESMEPEIQAHGKFGGVGTIEVTAAPISEEHRGLLVRTFGGDLIIQLSRSAVYTIATVLAVIALTWLISSLDSKRRQWKRKRFVKKFRLVLDHRFTKEEQIVFDQYISARDYFTPDGDRFAVLTNSLLTNIEERQEDFAKWQDIENTPKRVDLPLLTPDAMCIPFLLRNGIVKKGDNIFVANTQVADTMAKFEAFLLAHDPKRIKGFKVPYGSDEHPLKAEELSVVTATEKPQGDE